MSLGGMILSFYGQDIVTMATDQTKELVAFLDGSGPRDRTKKFKATAAKMAEDTLGKMDKYSHLIHESEAWDKLHDALKTFLECNRED